MATLKATQKLISEKTNMDERGVNKANPRKSVCSVE